MQIPTVIFAVTCFLFFGGRNNEDYHASPNISLEFLQASRGQYFSLKNKDGVVVLSGSVGLGSSSTNIITTQDDSCIHFSTIGSSVTDVLEDCIDLDGAHWYGGPEQYNQHWPLDEVILDDYSYVTKSQDNQGIAEPYWISSKGIYIYVQPTVPLFIDTNHKYFNKLCLIAKSVTPYPNTIEPALNYTVCSYQNAREAHEHAIWAVLGKPSGYPDERMIRYPIWSTWVRYKRDINETIVLEFADEILAHNFNSSQLEIDDNWEDCYGALSFKQSKFPNPKNLTDTLKAKGFRVTLWIHPFVNVLCNPQFQQAEMNGYFVYNSTDNSTKTSWWNGVGGIIDFTNSDAVKWYVSRLQTLKEKNGIDAFKFDAGETSWLPQPPHLNAKLTELPGIYTNIYVHTVSKFGPMIEVRVGQQSQNLPNFVRMIDKDTRWSISNGLKSLVTTLLQMNMVGYPLVLPDMIGGNGYDETPTKELFIRWMQANVFMPSLQYSYVPWDFDDETVEICRNYTDLHAQYADKIIELAVKATQDGSPINPPIWWIDPTDETAQVIDSEFLLGEDILVAPVLDEGATSRDIYLPTGQWHDKLRSGTIIGPKWLKNYTVALNELAYFTRVPNVPDDPGESLWVSLK